MSEHDLLLRDGERVCAVTITDVQGDLAGDVRAALVEDFEEA